MRGGGQINRCQFNGDLPCRFALQKTFCRGKSWKYWELALSSCNTKILLKVSCSRLGPCSIRTQVRRPVDEQEKVFY